MKGIPTTSTTLLRDIAQDSQHARWAEFVARYRPMMLAYLKTHFPALDADDVIQETLAALAAVLPRYRYAPDETGRFHNYLTGVLRHKALKLSERLARDSALKESLMVMESSVSKLFQDEDAESEWRSAVMEIAVRQLLADDSIHERSKQIFQRLTVDCMSPEVIAEAYGVSRNSVDKIKSRMIERLREIVRALEAAGDV